MKNYIYILILIFSALSAESQNTFSDYDLALQSKDLAETLILRIEEDRILDERVSELRNLKELRILSFPGKTLNLPKELEDLPNLKTLSIYGRELTVIPTVVFDLKHLKDLRIGYYQLEDSNSLRELKQIESLLLFSDSTDVFPTSIYQLESLKSLIIQGSSIKEIPDGISKLNGLTHLTFDVLNLCKAPQDLNKLENLKYIHLRIETNVTIKLNPNLPNLREFSWYKAQVFPKFICDYPSVERLQLWQGNIISIPNSICKMTKLRDFTVSNHPLKDIPKCVNQLENITMMDFRSTRIQTIDESILKLPKLFNILIEDCEQFDSDSYEYLKKKYGAKLIK